jgi:hypothetical protein
MLEDFVNFQKQHSVGILGVEARLQIPASP